MFFPWLYIYIFMNSHKSTLKWSFRNRKSVFSNSARRRIIFFLQWRFLILLCFLLLSHSTVTNLHSQTDICDWICAAVLHCSSIASIDDRIRIDWNRRRERLQLLLLVLPLELLRSFYWRCTTYYRTIKKEEFFMMHEIAVRIVCGWYTRGNKMGDLWVWFGFFIG